MSEAKERPYHWRSFQVFNGYRLLLAGLLVFTPWFAPDILSSQAQRTLYLFGGIYIALIITGLLLSLFYLRFFQAQITLQVLLDIVTINALILLSGNGTSGLGIVLLVSIAGASLVAQGRMALFYASIATCSVLSMEILNFLDSENDTGHITQGAFLSLGFFTTAISAHLLGRRLVANEALARRRGEALKNQNHINRRIMERMQDGVLVVGPDGTILQANPQGLSILGEAGQEGSNLDQIHPGLTGDYLSWRDQHGSKRIAFSLSDGKELSARFARTLSSDGAALVFLEDQDQLREQAQQLKLASLGRLTASIAHEIRNPLSAISHAGDLLAEEGEEQIKQRLLRIIRDNTQRLDRIIQDVLVLGRQRTIPQETIRLKNYLEEFAKNILTQEHLEQNVIQIHCPRLATLCFVPGQLHQVLWNVLGNALRHSCRAQGSVTIKVKTQPNRVELHIMDDGPGVPVELREQIFEPFFTTASQGTGLGLHIARELSEANGARLLLGPQGPGAHFVLIGRIDPCLSQEANLEEEN